MDERLDDKGRDEGVDEPNEYKGDKWPLPTHPISPFSDLKLKKV